MKKVIHIKTLMFAGMVATTMLLAFPAFAEEDPSVTYSTMYIPGVTDYNVDGDVTLDVNVAEINALEITLSTSNLAIDLTPKIGIPSFDTDTLDILVGTTNITGYTLTMASSYNGNSTTSLTRTESISSTVPTIDTIGSTITPTDFASTSDTSSINKWGYLLSATNLDVNKTVYNPVLSSNTVNSSTEAVYNDPTTITFGAKVDSDLPAGNYRATLKFMAVSNINTYSIMYNAGSASSDSTLANMPSPNPQTGALEGGGSTTIVLSNTTPSRTGYSFGGWCTMMPATSGTDPCGSQGGTVYGANSDFVMSNSEPDTTLYAIWNIGQFACTKQYRLQNADGSWGSYVSDTGENVDYGETCTYSKSVANYRTENGANNSTATTSGVMTADGITLQLSLYRNTYSVTVNKDSTYITSVSGAGTYRWGETVTIGATASANNEFTSWTQNSGTTVTYTNSTSASSNPAKFTMPTSNVTFTANGESKTYIQDFTKTMCQTKASSANYTVYDKRDENSYTVRYINGNCWMTQNLRFSGSSIDSTNTNINTSKTISWGDLTSGNSYDAARYHNSGNTTNGYWYNYPGASAMTITDSYNSTEASYDICPKNWHLPSNSLMSGITSYKDAFSPVTGGYYYSGSVRSTGNGYWWSSTADGAEYRYSLRYNGSSLSTDDFDRFMGGYVRCVRTS